MWIFFSFVLFTLGFANPIQRREHPEEKKISVIVPCAGQHFKLLAPLLERYRQQVCLPDEIVISLSSIEHLQKEEIDALEKGPWPFDLKIYRFTGKQSPGLNRNIAVSHTIGDVIISQDADDLPHPQRVEIVKFIFENYIVDHLMHKWVAENSPLVPYDKAQVQIYRFDAYDDIYKSPLGERLHNGNNAFSREVSKIVQWVDVKKLDVDQDVKFNRDVYKAFKNNAIIACDLLVYRWGLSALQSNPSWP